MPTRNLNLSDELDRFITARVESGLYDSPTDVVSAALKALEVAEEDEQAKLAALRAAIDEGEASGLAEGDVMDKILERLRSRAVKQ